MEKSLATNDIKKILWKKLGLIVPPMPEVSWLECYAGPSCVEVFEDFIRLYISGRDSQNVSRIGIVDFDMEQMKIIRVSAAPLFDIGDPGCFDENGVSYPWIIDVNNKRYMYYVGWVNGGRTRFQNYTGLAISEDGGRTYQRAKKVPVLDRTDDESVGSGSSAVIYENSKWRIWYTSFVKWEVLNNNYTHFYHIKYAESDDGINWNRQGKVAIDFKDSKENTIGKPAIFRDGDLYKMYYSYRSIGAKYRIGYAESNDGMNWIRKDDQINLDVSSSGWDSEMIEYAYLFNYKNKKYMIYNGNDFGKTGLGLAVLEQ